MRPCPGFDHDNNVHVPRKYIVGVGNSRPGFFSCGRLELDPLQQMWRRLRPRVQMFIESKKLVLNAWDTVIGPAGFGYQIMMKRINSDTAPPAPGCNTDSDIGGCHGATFPS